MGKSASVSSEGTTEGEPPISVVSGGDPRCGGKEGEKAAWYSPMAMSLVWPKGAKIPTKGQCPWGPF